MARVLSGSWRAAPPPLELTPEELDLVVRALHRSGCSGLAWRRLERTPLRDRPAGALLHDGFVYHTLRVRALERQLGPLVVRLRERGVEVVLGKGWAVGRGYPLAGLRPYGDLDFLVHPSDLPEARRELAGWDGIPPAVEWHEEFNELRDRSRDELFQRSRLVDLSGVPIRVFAPEDHLRLLALHALEHGLSRPFWLCDVALLLETLPVDFDWALCTQGGAWEGEGVRCLLGLVRELLGVDLQAAGVPPQWRNPPLPPWLVPAALEALGAGEHYLQAGSPEEQLLSPGALLESARLRWANAIEVTFRRRLPWSALPRAPFQVLDYAVRGVGFLSRAPSGALRLWRERRGDGAAGSD